MTNERKHARFALHARAQEQGRARCIDTFCYLRRGKKGEENYHNLFWKKRRALAFELCFFCQEEGILVVAPEM